MHFINFYIPIIFMHFCFKPCFESVICQIFCYFWQAITFIRITIWIPTRKINNNYFNGHCNPTLCAFNNNESCGSFVVRPWLDFWLFAFWHINDLLNLCIMTCLNSLIGLYYHIYQTESGMYHLLGVNG